MAGITATGGIAVSIVPITVTATALVELIALVFPATTLPVIETVCAAANDIPKHDAPFPPLTFPVIFIVAHKPLEYIPITLVPPAVGEPVTSPVIFKVQAPDTFIPHPVSPPPPPAQDTFPVILTIPVEVIRRPSL